MSKRVIAIGDIHGCARALSALLRRIDPQPDDTIVPLGDMIDRGPNSRDVLDQLLALEQHCNLRPLLGNHEEMLLLSREDPAMLQSWLTFGGTETLASYGPDSQIEDLPKKHLEFFDRCANYYEIDHHIFAHANYEATVPLAVQSIATLRWLSLKNHIPTVPHISGKTFIVGHSAQKDGTVLDLGHLKCIDTFCYGGGWLTGLNVIDGTVWQVDREGVFIDEA